MLFLETSGSSFDPSLVSLLLLALAIIPIVALMVFAIVVALRNSAKKSQAREQEILETVDESQVELFLDVYGGKDNIVNVERKLSRVNVTVKDLEKVKLDELPNLGASGALVVGAEIRCSYGDRAPYVYEILKGGEDK